MKPSMIRASVVLPLPLSPAIAVIEGASSDSDSVMSSERVRRVAVRLGRALQLDQRAHGATSSNMVSLGDRGGRAVRSG